MLTNEEYTLDIPEPVLETLKTIFPDVDDDRVEWSWEVYNKIYEAEFEQDGKEYEVEITVTGHHLLTETEIRVDEVPANILATAKAYFPKAEITEAEHVQLSTGNVFYELNIVHEGSMKMEVHISDSGELLALGHDL